MPDKPVSFCGECGKHYAITVHECPTCEKTLVVWRPKRETEQHARAWWSIVNWLPRARKQRV